MLLSNYHTLDVLSKANYLKTKILDNASKHKNGMGLERLFSDTDNRAINNHQIDEKKNFYV